MNFLVAFKWDELLAAFGVTAIIWGIFLLLLRRALSNDFVTKDNFSAFFTKNHTEASKPMDDRLTKLETLQAIAPTQEAVKDIERRVERVEIQVTEVQRTVTDVQVGVGSLKQGQQAISRQLDIIMTHLISAKENA